jgi:hypothetical protein
MGLKTSFNIYLGDVARSNNWKPPFSKAQTKQLNTGWRGLSAADKRNYSRKARKASAVARSRRFCKDERCRAPPPRILALQDAPSSSLALVPAPAHIDSHALAARDCHNPAIATLQLLSKMREAHREYVTKERLHTASLRSNARKVADQQPSHDLSGNGWLATQRSFEQAPYTVETPCIAFYPPVADLVATLMKRFPQRGNTAIEEAFRQRIKQVHHGKCEPMGNNTSRSLSKCHYVGFCVCSGTRFGWVNLMEQQWRNFLRRCFPARSTQRAALVAGDVLVRFKRKPVLGFAWFHVSYVNLNTMAAVLLEVMSDTSPDAIRRAHPGKALLACIPMRCVLSWTAFQQLSAGHTWDIDFWQCHGDVHQLKFNPGALQARQMTPTSPFWPIVKHPPGGGGAGGGPPGPPPPPSGDPLHLPSSSTGAPSPPDAPVVPHVPENSDHGDDNPDEQPCPGANAILHGLEDALVEEEGQAVDHSDQPPLPPPPETPPPAPPPVPDPPPLRGPGGRAAVEAAGPPAGWVSHAGASDKRYSKFPVHDRHTGVLLGHLQNYTSGDQLVYICRKCNLHLNRSVLPNKRCKQPTSNPQGRPMGLLLAFAEAAPCPGDTLSHRDLSLPLCDYAARVDIRGYYRSRHMYSECFGAERDMYDHEKPAGEPFDQT